MLIDANGATKSLTRADINISSFMLPKHLERSFVSTNHSHFFYFFLLERQSEAFDGTICFHELLKTGVKKNTETLTSRPGFLSHTAGHV